MEPAEGQGPRILLLDLETAAVLGWSWAFYDTNLIDTFRDWSILCYAFKWDDEKKIQVSSITRPRDIWDFIRHPDNDKALVKELWRLLDQADFVVAHNAKSFDVKKCQSRFLHYGLPPPSPFKVIDTLTETRRISNNTRNNQDALLKSWGLGKKLENRGWPMWRDFKSGDRKARKEMLEYNKVDIVGLAALFKHLRPWISSVNSSAMHFDATTCPKPGCGSKSLQNRGWFYTKTTQYRQIRCNLCHGWSRITQSEPRTKPLVSI